MPFKQSVEGFVFSVFQLAFKNVDHVRVHPVCFTACLCVSVCVNMNATAAFKMSPLTRLKPPSVTDWAKHDSAFRPGRKTPPLPLRGDKVAQMKSGATQSYRVSIRRSYTSLQGWGRGDSSLWCASETDIVASGLNAAERSILSEVDSKAPSSMRR